MKTEVELREVRAQTILDEASRKNGKVTRERLDKAAAALFHGGDVADDERTNVIEMALRMSRNGTKPPKKTSAQKATAPESPPKAPKRSARERFKGWVRERLADRASFKIPDIVKEAEKRFGSDADFLRAYARDAIRQQMYVDIQHVAAESRAVVIGSLHIDAARLEDAAKESARAVWGRWETCFEHVGDRHVLWLDMTDRDLGAVEASRFEQAESHARWGRFASALRKNMQRGKKVRECYSTAQLDELWQTITDARGAA